MKTFDSKGSHTKTSGTLRSLSRAITILNAFNAQQSHMSGAEVARKIGVSLTTSYRLLACLNEGRLLTRDPSSGKYTIGPQMYVLGNLYLGSTDFVRVAATGIKELNELTGEALSVGIPHPDRDKVVIILREESKFSIRWEVHIGTILPAHASALGKALLSTLTDVEIGKVYPEERLQQLTNKTIATKTQLKLDLERVRKTGVGYSVEETEDGVIGIASFIRNASGKAIGALSVATLSYTMDGDKLDRLSNLVKKGASFFSYQLGYQDMSNPVRDIKEIAQWWERNNGKLPTKSVSWRPLPGETRKR